MSSSKKPALGITPLINDELYKSKEYLDALKKMKRVPLLNDTSVDRDLDKTLSALLQNVRMNEKKIMELAEENDVMGQQIRKLVSENSSPKVNHIVMSLKK